MFRHGVLVSVTVVVTGVLVLLSRLVDDGRLGGARCTTWRDDASPRTGSQSAKALEELRTLSDPPLTTTRDG